MKTIHVKNGLEPFWDEYLVDERHTTAKLSVNRPDRVGSVLLMDRPWEKSASYYSIVRDTDRYRMYMTKLFSKYVTDHWEDCGSAVSYLESEDGIHWERPVLGLYAFKGNYENNIILMDDGELSYDAVSVFIDENPDCPTEERYKGIVKCHSYYPKGFYDPFEEGMAKAGTKHMHSLVSYVSEDGIHFKKHSVVSKGISLYDSLNTVCYNQHTGKYTCFLRSWTTKDDKYCGEFNDKALRAVSITESVDFMNWSEPKFLEYLGDEDYPMYTNGVLMYPYDDRYYVGFPTRYNERKNWTGNFDRLCGRKDRALAAEKELRDGTAVTDGLFMSSRDGYHWRRFDEAILTGGPEQFGESWTNWLYGDGYPAQGLVETPPRIRNAAPEISILVPEVVESTSCEEGSSDRLKELVRYAYRRDGFASYKAPYEPKVLRTKLFTFEGSSLKLNFRTSGRGGIVLRILDERNVPIDGYTTYEIFGDSVERIVDFDKPLADLQGRRVSFEFTMRDAEIYAMRFCD